MGKGLGIAVLIVAVVAIIIPLYGIYLGLITAILGIGVALAGEVAMAVAIGALNILNAVFLSPSLKLAGLGARLATGSGVNSASVIFWLWVGAGAASIVIAVVVSQKAKAGAAAPTA
jgi:hypothetical protein